MNERRETPVYEIVVNGLFLFLAYLVLFLMPRGESFGGYLLLGISTFLFCIGYFRLVQSLPQPVKQSDALRREWLLDLIGVCVLLFGCWLLYRDGGSVRGICVATILLIESMVVLGQVIQSAEEEQCAADWVPRRKHEKRRQLALRAVVVLMAAAAVALFVFRLEAKGGVETATMLIIAALVLWFTIPAPTPE
jgi:hypothetical protein